MSEPINTGGPAFPEAGLSGLPNDQFFYGREGQTLRDYFAAKAMQALINRNKAITGMEFSTYEQQWVPGQAYAMADAMIKARGL